MDGFAGRFTIPFPIFFVPEGDNKDELLQIPLFKNKEARVDGFAVASQFHFPSSSSPKGTTKMNYYRYYCLKIKGLRGWLCSRFTIPFPIFFVPEGDDNDELLQILLFKNKDACVDDFAGRFTIQFPIFFVPEGDDKNELLQTLLFKNKDACVDDFAVASQFHFPFSSSPKGTTTMNYYRHYCLKIKTPACMALQSLHNSISHLCRPRRGRQR